MTLDSGTAGIGANENEMITNENTDRTSTSLFLSNLLGHNKKCGYCLTILRFKWLQF